MSAAPATRRPFPAALAPFFRAEAGLFLLLWGLAVVDPTALLQDPGTFWHTVVGERVLAGDWLGRDPFSCTHGGEPWIAWQWLGEVTMALLHRAGGFDLMVTATAVVLAALFTAITVRARRAGLHWLPACSLGLFAFAVAANQFHVRPLVFTLVAFAATCVVLLDFEAGRVRLAALGLLVPLFIVWGNTHGGVLGGFGTVGLAAAGWSLWFLLGRPPLRSWAQVAAVWLLVAALAASSLLNPYGWRLPALWLDLIFAQPELRLYIIEHMPLSLLSPDGQLVLALALGYTGLLLSTWGTWPRITWLLPLVWLTLAWERARHAPLFALAAALAATDLFPHSRLVRRLVARGSDLFLPPAGPPRADWRPWLVPATLVGLAVVFTVAGVRVPVVGAGWARFDGAKVPVDLLGAIREAAAHRPNGAPLYNELNDGGFLIYHAPSLRVFNDDRCELHRGPWHLRTTVESRSRPAVIEEWRRRYGFDLALVRTDGPDAALFDYLSGAAGWHLLARGRCAALFEYTGP